MDCFSKYRRSRGPCKIEDPARSNCYQAKMNAIHSVLLQTGPRTIHSRPAPRIYALAALNSPRFAQPKLYAQGLAIFAARGRAQAVATAAVLRKWSAGLAHCKMHGRSDSKRSHRVVLELSREEKRPHRTPSPRSLHARHRRNTFTSRRPSSSRSRSRPPRRSSARRRPRHRRS